MRGARELTKRPHLEDQLYEIRGEEDDRLDDKRLTSTLQLIYTASKVQIYKIADKVASCEISRDEKLWEERQVEIPVREKWDFKLGDRVTVKYTYDDFRTIQIQTIGWNKRLHGVHEHGGIVTRIKSEFSNTIQVYTPELFCTSSLYAGVLDKVPAKVGLVSSQWKVGDYVKTKTDKKVVKLLQSRLDPIPDDLVGKRARVIAVTNLCVIVTFDELISYDLNSYLLLPCQDNSPIAETELVHSKGFFRVGEKVQVTSNFMNLIKNQAKIGWNPNMTALCGQEVTVTAIRNDGNVNVQMKSNRGWRINPNSIHTLVNSEADGEEFGAEISFKPQDKVKIKLVPNTKTLLAAAEIPLVFLEYLKTVANVKLIDKELDCLLQFNSDQKVSAYASTLRKATAAELEEYNRIQKGVDGLKIGDAVHLDIGPPNFVRAVLSEVKASREVVKALTTSPKLVGFTEGNRAVIEYKNGRRYRIRKELLTVPEKFGVSKQVVGINIETVKKIQTMILKCVEQIDCDAENTPSAELLSVSNGFPPAVDFIVVTEKATYDDVKLILENDTNYQVKELCPGRQLLVSGLQNFEHEVKVGLTFNDEFFLLDGADDQATAQSEYSNHLVGECQPPKLDAVPPPEYREVIAEEVPDENFSWMCLYDPRLARKLYFPYRVHRARNFSDLEGPVENTARATIRNSERNVIANI